MKVSIVFRSTGSAPARASRVATVLEEAGHDVLSRPVKRSPAALLKVIGDSPDVLHACGSDVWRAASLAARVTRACVVYEPVVGRGLARSERRRVAPCVRRGRSGAVLARDEHQASEFRSVLGLPCLPPVVGPLEPSGEQTRGARVLTALYDRLPHLNPDLPFAKSRSVTAWRRSVISERGAALRRGGLRHPFALFAYLQGRRLRARGRPREAALALGRARQRDPENGVYALYLAGALREAGSRDDAAWELKSLVAGIGDRDPSTLGQAGVEFARLKLPVQALKTVQTLRGIERQGGRFSVDALAQAALVSVELGDLRAARELASSAAAAAPDRSPAQRTAALALERAGEPTRALGLARRSGAAQQERRLSGVLRVLEPEWGPQLPSTSRADRVGGQRVLCLLEASLPQTPSGYAYRSRDLQSALRAAKLDPFAATRLGFPASRGNADYSPIETIDEVVHHRFNVPGLRQYSGVPLDQQLQENAERLLELVKGTRPGLILAGTPHLNGALALAIRTAVGTPVVYDVRGFPEMTWATQAGGSEGELYRRRRNVETSCAAAADAVITLSETMRAELVGRGLDPNRVFIVPHIVDTDRYSPRPRDEELARSYGIDGKFTVGTVASLTDYEGIDTLLRAVARAHASRPDISALIVGDGPARASLEALAAELGIEDTVVFTGRLGQDRVPEHYALLDLFVLPRDDLEACRAVTPLKPFEALAMGVPVIASDLPALAELVSASGGGRLVEPGSDQSLAALIVGLADDASAREALAANAREYAITHHNLAKASAAIRLALVPLLT